MAEPSLLVRRLLAACQAMGVSPNRAGIDAGVGRDFIRDIDRRAHDPAAGKLKKLALRLEVPVEWLVNAIDADDAEIARGTALPPPATLLEQGGQEIKDPKKLRLLRFWDALENDDERVEVLEQIVRMAVGARKLA